MGLGSLVLPGSIEQGCSDGLSVERNKRGRGTEGFGVKLAV